MTVEEPTPSTSEPPTIIIPDNTQVNRAPTSTPLVLQTQTPNGGGGGGGTNFVTSIVTGVILAIFSVLIIGVVMVVVLFR